MVKAERIQALNSKTIGEGPVVYWMNRDCRIHDNWAYEYARELALDRKVPLLVMYNLAPGFLGGGFRQHAFKVKGLQEVAEQCAKMQTPFFLVCGNETEKELSAFAKEYKIGAIVTDFFPLRLPRAWVEHVCKEADCAVFGVDAHNVIPCWITSEKQEFAARTIRPKIHRLLPEYFEEFPTLKKYPHAYQGVVPEIKWDKILGMDGVDTSVQEVDWIAPGYKAGMKAMHSFINERLYQYGDKRNDPMVRGQSDLSPYLHYGQIAPARVALEVVREYAEERRIKKIVSSELIQRIVHKERNGSGEEGNSYESFLEELIVRRELSDNFCFYNPAYDSVEGFATWAKAMLDSHRDDQRVHIYTREEFEYAQTHDELWNAAQNEMVRTGKMAGYVRMYWGKKILEWTRSPEEAMGIAIYLNDKYELDGRDPNGYTGISWSLGGTHDRSWFQREIFGTVRYMARSGCEKKFDVKAYIQKWT